MGGVQIDPDRRSAERFMVSWPVETDRGPGITRDLSLSGLYILTKERLDLGGRVHMMVTLSDSGDPLPFRLALEGRVVRVEQAGDAQGAGISLNEEGAALVWAS